ncbi:hypothetical protein NIES23_44690 [Trichormus variabilis NIES-23]|uniref:Uncharacterized protein n=1 Tax=Trichormus variabilis NIES-23 TaxID=1973479 RepID=A0A1Z4KRN5_ANAVA|nr:hypothetical protein NIES23_44690 [Trichormus variabilis NIES-23]
MEEARHYQSKIVESVLFNVNLKNALISSSLSPVTCHLLPMFLQEQKKS